MQGSKRKVVVERGMRGEVGEVAELGSRKVEGSVRKRNEEGN